MSDYGEGVICDFGMLLRSINKNYYLCTQQGLSKIAKQVGIESGFTTTTVRGTLAFMAPELHDDSPVWTPATDVYAFAGACLQVKRLTQFYVLM